MRSDSFKAELALIENRQLRNFIRSYLDEAVPAYFWVVPASSSGKYHPQYALGVGGLVRHTKACVAIAEDLLSLEQNETLNVLYHDEIISALIIHDSFKQGIKGGSTVFDHPLLAVRMLIMYAREHAPNSDILSRAEKIARLVASHMGQWNRNARSLAVLPKPTTEAEQFVHMCDYLASRKYLTVDVSYEPPKEEQQAK